MIKFFRKIRRKLLTENNFSKYFIYALGEIFLVVIGILIALNINNWNENQKQLKLEKEILGEVKIGLESDYINISNVIKDHRNFINSQDIIIDWIESEKEYTDSLIPHFKHTTWTSWFLPKDAQFESLKQFGIRNISNGELGDQINNLYDVVYEEVQHWQNETKNRTTDFLNTFDELGFEVIKDTAQISLDYQPIDPTNLQLDKAYIFNLRAVNTTMKIYTGIKLKNAKNEIDETLKLMEIELKQKKRKTNIMHE